ncbi:DIP1281 family NlpC/P60 protein [Corynebacterium flavescens]|uniref:DIP1281 family NlpC/P60 protein n=1 Tax=Corynebacterium flavescens TaxID=28028 RepID=UPI003FD2EEFD
MATIFKNRTKKARSLIAAVACTATLSVVSTLSPVVAQASPATDITALLSSGNASVAQLANALADVQDQVSRIEGEIGGNRENVNRALVDLQDARTEAQQAKQGTAKANEELDQAQSDVEKAQSKLDELSRTAYRRANTSDVVTNASGADSRRDKLERDTYLRTQTKEQQAVVDDLTKVRTEKANRESQLRQVQKLAEDREDQAESAESAARKTLDESLAKVQQFSSQREELIKQEKEVQTSLNKAKGVDSKDKSTESTRSSDSTAHSNVNGSTLNQGAHAPAATAAAGATTGTPSNAASGTATESATASEPATGSETGTSEAAVPSVEGEAQTQATRELRSGGTGPHLDAESAAQVAQTGAALSSDPAVQQMSANGLAAAGAPDNAQELLNAGSSAVSAAASIVAASQPNHTGLSGDQVGDLVNASSQLLALQGVDTSASSDSEVLRTLTDLLTPTKTGDEVTADASTEVSDMNRSQKIEAVISRGMGQIGMPYAWGGGDANGPTLGIRDGGVADSYGDYNKVGFDCSGLVLYAFAGVGISLPHYTGYQYQKGEYINPNNMERGDLIFYGPGGSQHVAIYLGDGTMLEAPQSGSTVQVSPVRWSGMTEYAVRLI